MIKKYIHRCFLNRSRAVCLILPLFFMASGSIDAASRVDPTARGDSLLFITADMRAFCDNQEYFSRLREGNLYLGAYIRPRLELRPSENFNFAFGAHLRKAFGDEDFFSDARPVFSARFSKDRFSFNLGELEGTEKCHGLPDALVREEYLYDPAFEEGLQIAYSGSIMQQDFWIVYDALNTPQHREHIMAGNNTMVHLGPVSLLCVAYGDHYGGQLYAPEGDPVRENVAGGGGAAYTYQARQRHAEIGLEQLGMGCATSNENVSGYKKGWGSRSTIWAAAFDTRMSLMFFKGRDFIAWQGNSLYNTRKPYVAFSVRRSHDLLRCVEINYGIQADFSGTGFVEYFKNPEYKVWVRMGYIFERGL